MDIISPLADRKSTEEALATLASSKPDTIHYLLHKFIYEVASAHNLLLESIKGVGEAITIEPTAFLVLKDTGLPAARLRVAYTYTTRARDEKHFLYKYQALTIKKDRSSFTSDRDERDSIKLSSLLRTLKKNEEIPTQENMQSSFATGIGLPFSKVGAGSNLRRSGISFDDSTNLALTKFVLGVDRELSSCYIQDLKDKYDTYLKKVVKAHEADRDKERYARGATVLCYYAPDGRFSSSDKLRECFIGEVTFDYERDKPTFHVPLKRCPNVFDTPLAPIVTMVKAYMEKEPRSSTCNDFLLPLEDTYYSELDIAAGYSNWSHFWVVIPKHAPEHDAK